MSERESRLRELYRRKRCQESLHSFFLNIEPPMAPAPSMRPDETLWGAPQNLMPPHIAKCLEVIERNVLRPFGRFMLFMPPGTMKSTLCQVALAWLMGRQRRQRFILTSYGSDLAQLQSRRCQSIVKQDAYSEIWDQPVTLGERSGAQDWSLTNESEMQAFGLLASINGRRANGILIDDPMAGREEADSPQTQKRTVNAYQGDVLSRLLPRAWLGLIMTRWNEADLAGYILPDKYKGESGMVKCKDGLMWEILNLPAKAENADDPLGRKPGEYIFPEYYPPEHWQMHENAAGSEAAREWASLYQQRPTAQGNGKFTKEMFEPYLYDADDLPLALTLFGTGDYATKDGSGDFTELAIWGFDSMSVLWCLEWWGDQVNTGVAIDRMLEMIERRKVRLWFNEGGVIDKSMRPAFQRRARELMSPGQHFCPNEEGVMVVCQKKHDVWCDLKSLPSIQDKVAKAMNFQARASLGAVRFPRAAPWREKVLNQLYSLPSGRYDDCVDVCGLAGRGIDQYHPAREPESKKRAVILPFTEAWFEMTEFPDQPPVRYR